jgi:signal transduction histidine kinase
MTPSIPAPSAPAARRMWRDALTWRGVALACALAVVVAALLNPIFAPPFTVLLGRTLFIALVLLVAFAAAGQWQQALLPRWLAQVLAVALAAPVATLVVYLVSVGGDLGAMRAHERITGFLYTTGSGLMVGLVLALGALYRERDAQARAQELQFALERETLERQALDARLSLLHTQIEPHFLFNTLANVQELVESGSPRAAEVLRSLTAYLRAAMPRLHDNGATLGDEEALVRSYLELMLMRMPDRLRFDVQIDPALRGLRFPPMALLTLVENAVRHGIDPAENGGSIDVSGMRDANGTVRVWVADTGVGMSQSARPGTGLTNLQARLQGFFGSSATLELIEQSPSGLRAQMSFRPAS